MLRALEKRPLVKDNIPVTFIGFGALEIGRDWGLGSPEDRCRPSDEVAGIVLNKVLDSGINFIDSARAYHRSEERIGKYLTNRRSEYVLATKCGEHSTEPTTYYDFSYEAVKHSIDISLEKLKTNQIDLLQIHFGPEPEKVLASGDTLRAMKEARAEGKVKYLGASTYGAIAQQCIESGDFDVLQLDYSLLNTKDSELITLCASRGIGVLIRGGLGYGRLTNKIIPNLDKETEEKRAKIKALLELVNGDTSLLTQIALHFLYQNKGITSILLGTKNVDHLLQNIDYLNQDVDSDILKKATEIAYKE